MIVFVVAIIFLLFVFAMVVFAVKTQKMWRRFEVHAGATVEGKVAMIDQYAAALLRLNESWWSPWSPWRQHALYEMRLQLEYHGLRDAFLNKEIPTMRPGIPAHECISLSKKLVPQFDFSGKFKKKQRLVHSPPLASYVLQHGNTLLFYALLVVHMLT